MGMVCSGGEIDRRTSFVQRILALFVRYKEKFHIGGWVGKGWMGKGG